MGRHKYNSQTGVYRGVDTDPGIGEFDSPNGNIDDGGGTPAASNPVTVPSGTDYTDWDWEQTLVGVLGLALPDRHDVTAPRWTAIDFNTPGGNDMYLIFDATWRTVDAIGPHHDTFVYLNPSIQTPGGTWDNYFAQPLQALYSAIGGGSGTPNYGALALDPRTFYAASAEVAGVEQFFNTASGQFNNLATALQGEASQFKGQAGQAFYQLIDNLYQAANQSYTQMTNPDYANLISSGGDQAAQFILTLWNAMAAWTYVLAHSPLGAIYQSLLNHGVIIGSDNNTSFTLANPGSSDSYFGDLTTSGAWLAVEADAKNLWLNSIASTLDPMSASALHALVDAYGNVMSNAQPLLAPTLPSIAPANPNLDNPDLNAESLLNPNSFLNFLNNYNPNNPNNPNVEAAYQQYLDDLNAYNPNAGNPNAAVDNPNVDNPNLTLGDPNAVGVDNPNLALDSPNVDNPNLAVDNPNVAVDNPNLAVDNPNLAVDNPNLAVDNPNLAVDNPNVGNPNVGNPNVGNPNVGNPNLSLGGTTPGSLATPSSPLDTGIPTTSVGTPTTSLGATGALGTPVTSLGTPGAGAGTSGTSRVTTSVPPGPIDTALGSNAKVQSELRRALALAPATGPLHNALETALAQSQKVKTALDHALKGGVTSNTGEVSKAIAANSALQADLRKALGLVPRNSPLHKALENALGDSQKVGHDLNQALTQAGFAAEPSGGILSDPGGLGGGLGSLGGGLGSQGLSASLGGGGGGAGAGLTAQAGVPAGAGAVTGLVGGTSGLAGGGATLAASAPAASAAGTTALPAAGTQATSSGSNAVPFFPPMAGQGGMAGAGQQQERERSTWLSADEEIWGTEPDVGPQVLGRDLLDDDDDADGFDDFAEPAAARGRRDQAKPARG